jgi:Ras-related protein Rab-21
MRCAQVGNEILLTIAGNKLDLERQRVVSKQEAQEYAESVGAAYSETSAKLGKGIDDIFGGMGKRLLQARGGGRRPSAAASGRTSGRSPMVIIDDDAPGGSERRGCCS